MSGRGAVEGMQAPYQSNSANIRLENVRSIWLRTSDPELKYLLLEDPETGDVLLPLIYMKPILEANYSRKLASLKHRSVAVPEGNSLEAFKGLLYWQWAFESPHAIKVLVRRELGESTPQGHLRLVILPIVYNALVSKSELREHPLFLALHKQMRLSSYWDLLLQPPSDLLVKLDQAVGLDPASMDSVEPLFRGPRMIEGTAMKYMFMFRTQEELEASKRTRTTTGPILDNLLTADYIKRADENPVESAKRIDKEDWTNPARRPSEQELVDMLVSQRPMPAPIPPSAQAVDMSVPLSTNQLKNILDVKVQEIMREISALKTSVLSIMHYVVGTIAHETELAHCNPLALGGGSTGTASGLSFPGNESSDYDGRPASLGGYQRTQGFGRSQRFSPYPSLMRPMAVTARRQNIPADYDGIPPLKTNDNRGDYRGHRQ